jgi:hypothetical protein
MVTDRNWGGWRVGGDAEPEAPMSRNRQTASEE